MKKLWDKKSTKSIRGPFVSLQTKGFNFSLDHGHVDRRRAFLLEPHSRAIFQILEVALVSPVPQPAG
jgi:hypothetical protein